MRFLYIYHGGNVPEDKQGKNIQDLWSWLDHLKDTGKEETRFVGSGVREIFQDKDTNYSGKVFGVSIINCENLEEAISLTKDWPELPYDGKIEILKALG